MQLFSADAKVFSKFFLIFYDPKQVKKQASKVAHNQPTPLLFHSPAQTTAHNPELIFHRYYEILGPDICSLICDQSHYIEVAQGAIYMQKNMISGLILAILKSKFWTNYEHLLRSVFSFFVDKKILIFFKKHCASLCQQKGDF